MRSRRSGRCKRRRRRRKRNRRGRQKKKKSRSRKKTSTVLTSAIYLELYASVTKVYKRSSI